MVWNRVRFFRKDGKRAYVHNRISQWVCSPKPSHSAIIAKELFESVAIKFLRRRSYKGRPAPTAHPVASAPVDRGRYLLSGLLHCALCKAMYVAAKNRHRKKKTQVYYVCNTKWRHGRDACRSRNINLAVAEGAVLETLLNKVLTANEGQKTRTLSEQENRAAFPGALLMLLRERHELQDALDNFRTPQPVTNSKFVSLGYVDQLVLTATYLLQGKGSSLRLADQVNELLSKVFDTGAVFVSLDRLERGRLISSRPSEAPEDESNLVFSVTPEGERMQREVRTAAKQLMEALNDFA